MTEERYNQNQTQFAAEQTLRQDPPSASSPAPPPAPADPAASAPLVSARAPKRTLPRWLWWVVGGVALFCVTVLVVARLPRQTATPAPEHTAVTQERPLSPMELRLEAAKTLLKAADPTTQGLPFPPVDMLLRIDKTR